MRILFAAAECSPFVKVGGLGDVIGTLPLALQRLGHSVRVLIPHYGIIADDSFGIKIHDQFQMSWNGALTNVLVSSVEHQGVLCHFLRGWPFFAANERFVYSSDEGIDVGRFLFFAAASLRFIARTAHRTRWRPDVIHLHDWHTAATAYLAATLPSAVNVLRQCAILFSVHNMQYQGWGIGWHIARAGLPPVNHPLLVAMGKTDNSLALGLAYSTMLSTVSPTYADEITTSDAGWGLDGIVHSRHAHLVGVLNGIDTEHWNPATSPHLAAQFDADSLAVRVKNKRGLQKELDLSVNKRIPLIGTVMRLVDQKGPGIMYPAVRHALDVGRVQFALLGSGQSSYEDAARHLARDFPRRAAARIGFDEPLAERIYAGIDLFLMPSLFEPCGIGQMIAMRYGALPLVRQVGGLADTVDPRTGFLVKEFDSDALGSVLDQALQVYEHDDADWHARQHRAMLKDFSWRRSAKQYVQLYKQAITLHQIYSQPGVASQSNLGA